MPEHRLICAYCAGPFTARRSTRRTCSDACRQALSRRARGWSPSSGKRRRRSSRGRLEATGRGHVADHRKIPRAALRFRPTECGAGYTLEGDDGRRWSLIDLGHRGPGTGGAGPWLLVERRPGPIARGRDGQIRQLFDAGDELEGPSSATRRGALVWAVLQVHRRTPRGYWLACALEDQARDLVRRARGARERGASRELVGFVVRQARELWTRAGTVRRSATPAASGAV